MTKHIFVTGGVISSLGKGITSASLGLILRRMNLNIRIQKMDPYLNVDPGTMSPFQHGEVYVTDDGAETDLDLGHYERYTGVPCSRASNFTSGRIYLNILEKERRGDYLGKTVQVVPHVTDEIKKAICSMDGPDVDVVITEIGGTVGDIEGLPFLEAIRQFRHDFPRGEVAYIHVTLVPWIKAAGEMKTKPTQQSVGKLREIGIFPDVLIVRTERPMPADMYDKIAMFCNVRRDSVIEEKDVDTSIYEVPVHLVAQGLDRVLGDILNLGPRRISLSDWADFIDRLACPAKTVKIAVVGKYIKLQDAYKSIYESLTHAGAHHRAKVEVVRVDSEDIEKDGAAAHLAGVDGILVPGGFGNRGIEGKILAARFAREQKIPYFGICLGMQIACIETARNLLGLADANSAEFAPESRNPVVALMDEQRKVTRMGGTMRLGAWPCILAEGSRAQAAYGRTDISERHRHRYEFNNEYRSRFENAGMRFSGLSPDGQLVEIVERVDHPWFVAGQFHPEFKSQPLAPQPLFRDFVGAALKKAGS
jgi:CTP synthase